jgi:hypothetical protein
MSERKEVSQMIYELALLQIEQRQRDTEREWLSRLAARRNRSHAPKQSMLQRITRFRRSDAARAA